MLLMPLPKKQDKWHGDSKTLELLHEIQGEGSSFSITISEQINFLIRKYHLLLLQSILLFRGRPLTVSHLSRIINNLINHSDSS